MRPTVFQLISLQFRCISLYPHQKEAHESPKAETHQAQMSLRGLLQFHASATCQARVDSDVQ